MAAGKRYRTSSSRAPRGYSRASAQRVGKRMRTVYHKPISAYKSRGELKFHDVDLDDNVIATGVNVTDSINKIPQGVTEITRIGRKATIRKIGWRFRLQLPAVASAGTGGDTVRVIMYQDKQTNGATAASTDLLETANFQSFRNLSNIGRFNILMDRTYELNSMGAAGDGTANDSLSYEMNDTFFKDVNIPIEFNAGAGAIGEIRTNNLGVFLVGNAGLASFTSKIRLRFTDS